MKKVTWCHRDDARQIAYTLRGTIAVDVESILVVDFFVYVLLSAIWVTTKTQNSSICGYEEITIELRGASIRIRGKIGKLCYPGPYVGQYPNYPKLRQFKLIVGATNAYCTVQYSLHS